MECPVCLENYTHSDDRLPKVLNCGHTFCAACIAQHSRSTPGSVRCPTCRNITPLGQVSVNFALRDAIRPSTPAAPAAPRIVARPPAMPTPEETHVAMTLSALQPNRHLVEVVDGPGSAALGADVLDVMVSLEPPTGSSRTPVDICCIVDVSDSMGTEAIVQDGGGAEVRHGLTILDIVRHALKTIIRNLEEFDRLAIVSYANSAKVVLELMAMTEAGRRNAESRLQQLQMDGMTNLWAGLQTGVELLEKATEAGRLQHVMLLTDGVPNLNPPRGIIPMLKRLKDKGPGGYLPCTVSTFGFGYELDSELLSQISNLGLGTYAFIPDAGFVGTVFVNAMTNLLVTMAKNVILTLQPRNGASFLPSPVLGGISSSTDAAGSLKVNLGTLQFGQGRNLIVRMVVPTASRTAEWLAVTCNYTTRSLQPMEITRGSGDSLVARGVLEVECIRLALVDTVRQAMQKAKLSNLDKMQKKEIPLPQAQAKVNALDTAISQLPQVHDSDAVQGLLEDLQGQVAGAFSREEWYTKWGVHYLPSLMCAHLTQQCNNFKDPGVQNYGGDLFQELRDKADDIFLALPAPVASVRPAPAPSPGVAVARPTQAPTATRPIQMAVYYDRGGG